MIIGGLIARMERVESDVQEIKQSQVEMLQILHSAQGGWRTMVTIGTIGAAMGGFVVSLAPWLSVKGLK